MAAYQSRLADLTSLGITVVAACVDPLEAVRTFARDNSLTFAMAHGVTDRDVAPYFAETADDHRGHYLQPMEFLVNRDGVIEGSLYASGGVGRMDVDAVLDLIRGRDKRRAEGGA